MIPMAPSTAPFSELSLALTLALLFLAPLAIAGVALVNVGLGRSRSAAQALLGNLMILAVSAIAFLLVGAALTGNLPGTAGGEGHTFQLAGKSWNWIGSGPLGLAGFGAAKPETQLALIFEFLAVALAAMLPWGSGADRWRLTCGCVVAAILAVVGFPLVAHWVWGGGWLAQLGVNFQLGAGFLDGGGAATVNVLGGLCALAVVWIAGPRKGKFPKEGLSTALPGHNAVYVLFGCLLALVGWLAWNAAGAVLFLRLPVSALPMTALSTLLSACGAVAATFTVTRIRFGKPDASLCANGWMAGLVASSACAAIVTPIESLFVGIVAGIFTPLMVELLELALSIDDPSGAITVHALGGIWSLICAGLFAPQPGQLVAQLIGISTLLGLVFPVVYFVFLALNKAIPFRVDPDGERMGMDLHELGGGAYPDFVIHRDESYR